MVSRPEICTVKVPFKDIYNKTDILNVLKKNRINKMSKQHGTGPILNDYLLNILLLGICMEQSSSSRNRKEGIDTKYSFRKEASSILGLNGDMKTKLSFQFNFR